MVGPSAQREVFGYLSGNYETSRTKVCEVIGMSRSTSYRKSVKDDSEVEQALLELSKQYPARGIDWFYLKLRQEGRPWNRKRVLRVYRKLNLKKRKKPKKRLKRSQPESLIQPLYPNISWSMDFMSDTLSDGRKVRTLNIIDDYNRECLAIECGLSIPSTRVTRILDWLIEVHGKPMQIRTDNGPEFTSTDYGTWCKRQFIKANYIQPGKPSQNGYIERFNRTYREDVLDAWIFESVNQLQVLSDSWKEKYNHGHPHQSLRGMTPIGFKYSRRKIIEASEFVKVKLNVDATHKEQDISTTLTKSTPSIGWTLHEHLNGII